MKLKRSNPEVKKVLKACFPKYNGRKIVLVTSYVPDRLDSYWDEGTKHWYVFYELATGKTFDVMSNHPMFEKQNPRNLKNGLPKGIILVEHCIFCGHDVGITIYAPDANLLENE